MLSKVPPEGLKKPPMQLKMRQYSAFEPWQSDPWLYIA